MPEVTITIGGRSFDVACQPGEEHFLHAAAGMLDGEARVLSDQIGRLPESRMLLMAGLMLADKTAGLEEDLQRAEETLRARDRSLADAEDRLERRARRIAELEEEKKRSEEEDQRQNAQIEALEKKLADQESRFEKMMKRIQSMVKL